MLSTSMTLGVANLSKKKKELNANELTSAQLVFRTTHKSQREVMMCPLMENHSL